MIVDTPLREAPLAILDLETTGLSADRGDRAIEVAVVLTSGFDETGHLSQLIDPQRPLDPRAMAVNGITEAMVSGQPVFAKFLPDLEEALAGRVLVAHNARFDLGFLRAEYRRAGREFPERPVLDTVQIAKRHFRFPRNGLGQLARHFGISTSGAHRALADVRMTLGVLAGLAGELETRGIRTVGELMSPQQRKAHAETRAERPGQAPTANADRGIGDAPPQLLVRALAENPRLAVRYRDARGRETVRVLRPRQTEGITLTAFCESAGEERSFRLDRIVAFKPL